MNNFIVSLIPFLSFLYTSTYYLLQCETFQIFWLCNILNLVLFLAILFNSLTQIWSATILLIIGAPLWLYEDIIVNHIFRWNAFFVHIVAAAIGLIVIKKNHYPKYVKTYCMLWLLIGFFLARIFTEESHNVNLAYFVYPTLTKFFPSFWLYSLFNITSFFIGIWALDKLLKNFVRKSSISVTVNHNDYSGIE